MCSNSFLSLSEGSPRKTVLSFSEAYPFTRLKLIRTIGPSPILLPRSGRLCGCELFGAGQAAVRKLDVM